MAKFGDIALGSLARRPVTVTDPRAGEMSFHVRYLDDTDDDQIEQGAEAFARARGASVPPQGAPLSSGAAQNPWRGNAHYERGYVLYTLFVACVDPDSPQSNPESYFRTIEEVQKLHPDTITQMYLAQRIFQSDLSPNISDIAGKDLFAHIVSIAISDDERPFVRLAPSLQWTLVRTLAVLCIASHGTNLLSSWGSVKNSIELLRRQVVEAVDKGEPFEKVPAAPIAKKAPTAKHQGRSRNQQKAQRRARK